MNDPIERIAAALDRLDRELTAAGIERGRWAIALQDERAADRLRYLPRNTIEAPADPDKPPTWRASIIGIDFHVFRTSGPRRALGRQAMIAVEAATRQLEQANAALQRIDQEDGR